MEWKIYSSKKISLLCIHQLLELAIDPPEIATDPLVLGIVSFISHPFLFEVIVS